MSVLYELISHKTKLPRDVRQYWSGVERGVVVDTASDAIRWLTADRVCEVRLVLLACTPYAVFCCQVFFDHEATNNQIA